MADVKIAVQTLTIDTLASGSCDDHMSGSLALRVTGAPGVDLPLLATIKLTVGSTFDEQHIEVAVPSTKPLVLDAQEFQRSLARCVAGILTASTGDVRLEPAKLVLLSGREFPVNQSFSLTAGTAEAGW